MDDCVWDPRTKPRVLKRPTVGWLISPDDRYIVWWEPEQDDFQLLRCAEISSGREVMCATGRLLGGAVWMSNESLWVLRQDGLKGFCVLVYAIPDGGVVHVVRHQSLHYSEYLVQRSLDGSTVMVAPKTWLGGSARSRTLPIVMLRAPMAEVIAEIDIDQVKGFESPDGSRREAIASLSPDGGLIAIAYNNPPEGSARAQRGIAVVKVQGSDRQRVPVVGATRGVNFDIDSLCWTNAREMLVSTYKIAKDSLFHYLYSVELDSSLQGNVHPFFAGQEPLSLRLQDISQDRQHLIVVNSHSKLGTIDLATRKYRQFIAIPDAFGSVWGADPKQIILGRTTKYTARLFVMNTDNNRSTLLASLPARYNVSLARSPAGRYAVVHWDKLRDEYSSQRVALVELPHTTEGPS